MASLDFAVTLRLLDQLTAPLKSVKKSTDDFNKSLNDAQQKVSDLNKAQKNLDGLKKIESNLEKTKSKITEASAKLEMLKGKMAATAEPGKRLTQSFESASRALEKLNAKQDKENASLDTFRSKLQAANVPLKNLEEAQKHIRAETEDATRALESQHASHRRAENRRQSFAALKDNLANVNTQPVKDMLSQSLDQAQQYQTLSEKFNQYGMGEAALKDAQKFVEASKVFGTSKTEMMRYFTEAQGIFRESGEHSIPQQMEAAKIAAPVLAKLNVASKGLDEHMQGLLHEQQQDMLRFIEPLSSKHGKVDANKFKEMVDSGFKAIQSSGGNVDWSQYRQFLSKAGSSAYGLSGKSLFAQLEPIIGEMKGGAAGEALGTSYNRLNGVTKIPNQVIDHLIDSGIWDGSKIIRNKMGGVKNFTSAEGPMKDSELFSKSPVEFYEQKLMPYYKSKGLSETAIIRENAMIFGRQGGKMFNLIEKQLGTIHKSAESFDKARGMDGAYDAVQKNYAGKKMELEAKWKDLELAVGRDGGVLDMATKALNLMSDAIGSVTDAASAHPALAKLAGGAGMAIAGIGGLAAATTIITTPFSILKNVAGTLGIRFDGLKAIFFGVGRAIKVVGLAFSVMGSKALPMLVNAFSVVRGAVMSLSAVMMANPILAVVAAIAIAAVLIYTNWGKITKWWNGSTLKKQVMPIATATLDYAKSKWTQLKNWWNTSTLAQKALGIATAPMQIARTLAKDFFKWWLTTPLGQKSLNIATGAIDWARKKAEEFKAWWDSFTLKSISASISTTATTIGERMFGKSTPDGARATGGPVRAGGIYRINELGPELLRQGGRTYLMADQDSNVVPLKNMVNRTQERLFGDHKQGREGHPHKTIPQIIDFQQRQQKQAAQEVKMGGVLNIKIDSKEPVRVTQMKSTGMQLNVHTGPIGAVS